MTMRLLRFDARAACYASDEINNDPAEACRALPCDRLAGIALAARAPGAVGRTDRPSCGTNIIAVDVQVVGSSSTPIRGLSPGQFEVSINRGVASCRPRCCASTRLPDRRLSSVSSSGSAPRRVSLPAASDRREPRLHARWTR
jgi:hypothetical protein